MSGILATIFVPMVLIQMTDGTELQAVGDNYPTFEACMVQAEADAKTMAREIEAIENELSEQVIQYVSITCEPMTSDALPEHEGYLPLEEAYSARR